MGVVYFSIIPTFEPSRYCKCWIVCFYYKYGIDAAFKATVYKKVCKRYYKEYPIILLKSIIKKCICWDRKIQ